MPRRHLPAGCALARPPRSPGPLPAEGAAAAAVAALRDRPDLASLSFQLSAACWPWRPSARLRGDADFGCGGGGRLASIHPRPRSHAGMRPPCLPSSPALLPLRP
eukprot:356777-Chlamydomonas_euryale.AAC.2